MRRNIPSRRIMAMAAGSAGEVSNVNLTTDLAAYWAMDEASGTRADSTSAGLDLTEGDGSIGSRTGKQGNAGDFINTNGDWLYLRRTVSTICHWQTDASMSFWVFVDQASQNRYIGGCWATDNNRCWVMESNGNIGDGQITLQMSSNGIAQSTDEIVSDAVGRWTHICLVWDDTANEMTPWIDGVAGTALSPPGTGMYLSNSDFLMGTYGYYNAGIDGFGFPFDGAIDEWGVWSRQLNSDEVAALYNSGDGISYSSF